jgi:polysaccharide export outer membrane protein
LQAVAQAQGTTEFTKTDEIVVFRTINGKASAALFDLGAIRGGRMPDPRIYPNDRIVVATDTNRSLIKDLISLTPIVGVFYQVFQ